VRPVPPDYPPEHHFLRDLALAVLEMGTESGRAGLPVVPAICGPSGGVSAGALATLVDVVGGGLAARAAQPDWIATADLTLHVVDAPDRGAVVASAQVLRAGRSTVVIGVDLDHFPSEAGTLDEGAFDASTAAADLGASRIAVATMTFAVLPRREGNPDITKFESSTGVGSGPILAGGGFRRPFDEELGIEVVDAAAGGIEVPIEDYVHNSFAAMQGGIVALVACRSADLALTEACGVPVETRDLQLTYLAQARVGPVRSEATVLAATRDCGSARVTLLDSGNGGRVTATAGVVATR
jgi:acyl-coenzyme A thioesterase PaaI-like protein